MASRTSNISEALVNLSRHSIKRGGSIYVLFRKTFEPLRRINFSSRRSAIASNYKTVAMVLADRGFYWRSVEIEKVQSNSCSISFDDEWERFSSLVSRNTLDCVENKPTPKSAHDVWENHFRDVITNAKDLHDSHQSFSNALFEALRNSLYNFVYPIANDGSNSNLIVLRSSRMNVGFGNEVHRTMLGFKKEYGMSRDSKPDHGCYVFGTNKRSSSSANEANEFYDMTAVVELKLESGSCRSFSVDRTNEIKPPNIASVHGPMGQAMLYSMDVWHCLARRGVSVNSVPVLVLAGKSFSKDIGQLCCVEGHLAVPTYCGEEFTYSVDRIVSFNGTTGLTADETMSADLLATLQDSRDKRALALYIKTMCTGLELAIDVSKKRSLFDAVSPISLCCHRLLKSEADVQLKASPIPREDFLRNSGVIINQGELFSLTRPTKECFSGLGEVNWFVHKNQDNAILATNCLVKVSCASVHSTYISHSDCDKALYKLHVASKSNRNLKRNISKVLLGYCYVGQSRSMVTIMKDLHIGDEIYQTLQHQNFYKRGKLPQLWAAFCILVKSLLLPMASKNVIHFDIRSNADVTYNILVFEKTTGQNCKIDLCLIDFDSLVVSNSISGASITPQDEAVYWEDLRTTVPAGVDWKSAHRYLLWQVLWIAYTWHPTSVSVSPDALGKDVNAHYFVHFLFVDSQYVNFKSWLGNKRVEIIKTLMLAEEISPGGIKKVLEVLKSAFQKLHP